MMAKEQDAIDKLFLRYLLGARIAATAALTSSRVYVDYMTMMWPTCPVCLIDFDVATSQPRSSPTALRGVPEVYPRGQHIKHIM